MKRKETATERQRRKTKEACLRKVAYPDRKSVRKAIRGIRRIKGQENAEVGYYQCSWCGQYHTYNKKKKERGKERIRLAKRRVLAEQERQYRHP